SRVQNEVADFYYRIVKQMSLNMLILVPCGIGLIAIAEPFSDIVLGEEWRDAAPLLQCMAGVVIVMSSHGLMCSILTVKKQLKV
ncbi:oligosaccharide flippase family protein, partial [Vibrio natriegens]